MRTPATSSRFRPNNRPLREPRNSPAAPRIPPKDRDAILQSLRAGVVPRRGLQHIQVGRVGELQAFIKDIERISNGGSAFRIVVGDYGAGKSFLLTVMRAIAQEKNLVTAAADLNPDRRLFGANGQARSLYAEMARNIATRTKPEGGAMASIVERFITTAIQASRQTGEPVQSVIDARLHSLSDLVCGYDFAQVVAAYWRGYDTGNDQLKNDAVRWLRGEFNTKTDARQALGVRTIIDDDELYDAIKLLGHFSHLAGYGGLVVAFDELVNLMKLPQATARNQNYEALLRMLNDLMQGSASHLGMIFGATPETVSDTRRGLFSYAALQSRLSENRFAAQHGVADYDGPVMRLANLSREDLYVLCGNLLKVHASALPAPVVPLDAIPAFLSHCEQRVGAAYFTTPRNTIRAWLDLLSVRENHPHLELSTLLEQVVVQQDVPEPLSEADESPVDAAANAPSNSTPPGTADDELASFRL